MANAIILGGGGGGVGSDELTATSADVRPGKTYVGADTNDESKAGTMAEKGAATYYPSASAQTINANQYLTGAQTINAVTNSNLAAAYIKTGVTISVSGGNGNIWSVAGTFTSDGTVTNNNQILSGYKAYSKGTLYTGNITTLGGSTITPNTSTQYVYSSGKYMSGNVTINPIPSTYVLKSSTQSFNLGSNLYVNTRDDYPESYVQYPLGSNQFIVQYHTAYFTSRNCIYVQPGTYKISGQTTGYVETGEVTGTFAYINVSTYIMNGLVITTAKPLWSANYGPHDSNSTNSLSSIKINLNNTTYISSYTRGSDSGIYSPNNFMYNITYTESSTTHTVVIFNSITFIKPVYVVSQKFMADAYRPANLHLSALNIVLQGL